MEITINVFLIFFSSNIIHKEDIKYYIIDEKLYFKFSIFRHGVRLNLYLSYRT